MNVIGGVGGERDKCQITGGVSAYSCADIRQVIARRDDMAPPIAADLCPCADGFAVRTALVACAPSWPRWDRQTDRQTEDGSQHRLLPPTAVSGGIINSSPRQLNGRCIEGYCPEQKPDRPTLTAHSHGPAEREERCKDGGSRAVNPSMFLLSVLSLFFCF